MAAKVEARRLCGNDQHQRHLASTGKNANQTSRRESFQDAVVSKKIEVLQALANAIEAGDSYTRWHSSRVAEYSRLIARRLGRMEKEVQLVYWAATVHDVGKIGIPEHVLNKEGKLTATERQIIQQHPFIGARILAPISSFRRLVPIVTHHHEHFDGSGYPAGLKGEAIPLPSRIIVAADAFEAMTADRCYRKRLSDADVRAELVRHSGGQFDPQVVQSLLDLIASGELQVLNGDFDYVI